MTKEEAINKIRVLLGAETKTEAFAQATLVDGTEVSVEGDFEVGKALSVITEEGNIPAPEGTHETTDGALVTVDESGVITSIEAVEGEEEEMADEDKKKKMADEDKKKKMAEDKTEKEMAEKEEEMLAALAEVIKPMMEEQKELKKQVEEMESKFQKFSKEPATKPVKKAEAFEANRLSAVERIAKIRKQSK